jgi:dipeptidyl aminopeptidase/acylaminoacyl peptidase
LFLVFLLLSCSRRPDAAPVPGPDAAAAPLAGLEGHWQLTWTRPAKWWPREFTGPLVVRRIDGSWEAFLDFEQSAAPLTLSAVGGADDHVELTFASGAGAVELRVARAGHDLVGQARWPDVIDWSPVVAIPLTPTPADLPGRALRPIRLERSPSTATSLSPVDAFETPWRPPPVLSGDGARVWIADPQQGGKLWTGPADGSVPLVPISDAIQAWRWAASSPSGSTLYVEIRGRIGGISQDGSAFSVADGLGEVRWIEPRWSEGKLVVASAVGDGVRVVDVSLTDSRVVERFAHATADDVVLDPSGSVRYLVDRERKRFGKGVFATLLTLRDPMGEHLGDIVRQPQWVRSTDLTPHIGSEAVHLLGGGDLATLGRVGPNGFEPIPSPGQWGDAVSLLVDPDSGAVDAVGWRAERLHWDARTPDGAELDWLQGELAADVEVLQRAEDDRRWVLAATSGSRPGDYLLFDRDDRTLRPLRAPDAGSERTWRPVDALALTTRDGEQVPAYVTRPDGTGPWPLVVTVHGGPWSGRHGWTFDRQAQQWAERGYATLAVDFRGTHGFGWARMASSEFGDDAMIHDVEDGIRWAIAEGIADPDRIAMVGTSYGGYAALRFATAEVPILKCAVGGLVRGNLTVPGGGLNIEAVKDAAWRRDHSPDRYTHRLTGPVLVWNGGRDGESADAIQDFVARAETHGKAVTWVRFPWEEHGLRNPANQAALNVIIDRFLSACLGGPTWDFPRDFALADLEVRAGAELVPGLSEQVR